jgi:hypothetical protein
MPDTAERRPRREGGAQDAATSASRVAEDLGIARLLAAAGARFFCAYPDPEGKTESGRQTGFMLPRDWENTRGAYIDAWKPGMALCMVTGHVLDAVDEDPRNGGDLASLNGVMPTVYAQAATPSGGTHSLIASLGVRKAKKNGIDVQAGDKDGTGRGFIFVAPTVRKSKVTGELVAYRWTRPPDPAQLNSLASDKSGARLAELVRSWRGPQATTGRLFQQPGTWWDDNTGPIPKGERHDKLVSYAGKLRDIGLPLALAEILMLRRLQDCEQPPAAEYPVTEAEALSKLHDVYSRYPAGEPMTEDAEPAVPGGDLAEIAAAFTPVDWHAAWDAKPEEIQWLIEPLIEAGQSVALYATPGTGKSLITLELAAGLATGRPVLGNPAKKPIMVVYVDMENREHSLVERLQAFGYKPDDLGGLVLFSFPSIAALNSLLGGQQILALAVTYQADIVIIDTTSRVVDGKENDADTYLAFYRHTVIPLRKRGIAMLRLDHPGKDVARGTRGSSAKKGDVDAEWLLTKLSEGTFGLDRQKERENHGDAHIGLRRRFEPLRHELTSGSGDRAGEVAAELDRLQIPPGTGRVIAGKALRDAGIKVRANDLAEALRRRNAVPFQPSFDDSPAVPKSWEPPGTAHRSDTAGDGSHHPHSGGNREPSPVPGEAGPCAWCGQPCTRYGDHGRPLCDNCHGGGQ